MQDTIRVPKARIAVIIGEKGEIKKRNEKATHTQINIDSVEGDITIIGNDGLNMLIAKNIIQAIGRGFNPDIALDLLSDEMAFELIDLSTYARNKNDIKRIKSRVIGSDGKARTMLENLTNTKITVYGKTVGIIGTISEVNITRRSLISLLQVARHGNVYAMIHREKKKRK